MSVDKPQLDCKSKCCGNASRVMTHLMDGHLLGHSRLDWPHSLSCRTESQAAALLVEQKAIPVCSTV